MRKHSFIVFFISILLSSSIFISCATTSKAERNYPFADPYTVEFDPIEKISIEEMTPEVIQISRKSIPTKKLEAGKTYTFEIGPFNSPYVIVCISDFSNSSNYWNALENDGNNMFSATIQIPSNAANVYIAPSSSNVRFQQSFCTLNVYGKKKGVEVIEKKENVTHFVLNAPYIGLSKDVLYAGEFCRFDIGPNPNPYCIISMQVNSKRNYWIVLQNDGSNYFSTFQLIPDDVRNITISFSKDSNFYHGRAFYAKVQKSKNPYIFESEPYNRGKIKKYKSHKPDSRIIDFMKDIDARTLAKTEPDLTIEKTCDYIKTLTSDDFEKVKLINDAIWYLVSYDHDSLVNCVENSQDYKTVLFRGLSVCAGFSNVFSQFCKCMGIVELPVNGYARGIGWGGEKWSPKDNPTKSNHAWNIVKIGSYWYLVDVTWNCGSTRYGRRDDHYENSWLFPDPEEMIYSHFPLNKNYQLLEDPYTPKEFSQLPYIVPR